MCDTYNSINYRCKCKQKNRKINNLCSDKIISNFIDTKCLTAENIICADLKSDNVISDNIKCNDISVHDFNVYGNKDSTFLSFNNQYTNKLINLNDVYNLVYPLLNKNIDLSIFLSIVE